MTQSLQTQVLGGIRLRDALLAQVRTAVEALPRPPRLVILQVGEHPASEVYIAHKLKACAKVGIVCEVLKLPDDSEISAELMMPRLAADPTVHAVLLQLPLPAGWDKQRLLDMIPPTKDVDGLATASRGLRASGSRAALWPATPVGVMRLLSWAGISLAGKRACVIGRSALVGQPLAELLTRAGAQVSTIAKDTPAPETVARTADVLCVAAGAPGLVTAGWVKPGAVVVDIGLTRQDEALLGDVDVASVTGVASMLTPVPGGVGPMTVASLLTNVVDAAAMQMARKRVDWHLPR